MFPKMPDYDEYFDYTCAQGETWDSLAYDAYGDDDVDGEYLAHWLIQVNPKYMHTVMFEGGEVVQIPVFLDEDIPDDESLPPWERSDA